MLLPWTAKLKRAWRSKGGGVTTIVALALPALAVVAVGAIELQTVVETRQRTQDVADAAALFGAQQLAVSKDGVAERTAAIAKAELADLGSGATAAVDAKLVDKFTVKVSIDTVRPSFFVNLLPPGGFKTHVEATAQGSNVVPLCVLVFGGQQNDTLRLQGQAKLEAGECLVHANQNIDVASSALIQAFATQTARKAAGPIHPEALTGASDIADPFTAIDLSFPLLCQLGKILPDVPIFLNMTMPAGLHCGNFRIMGGAKVALAPGEHYFSGDLRVQDDAKLSGDDVVLVFDENTKFDFQDRAAVSLAGRRSGRLAGFVIAANRTNTREFTIQSDFVSKLLGTVYVPNATLVVNGERPVAQSSAWTVIAARAVRMTNSPKLIIHSNYEASNVPVPRGVGPTRAGSKLIQ